MLFSEKSSLRSSWCGKIKCPQKKGRSACVMTLNSRSNVVLGIVIYTAGKFHIGNPCPLRILSPTLPPPKKPKTL